MTTATETREDADLLESLDWEPRCQAARDDCHETATHVVVKACGCRPLFCKADADDALQRADMAARGLVTLRCSLCGAEPTPGALRAHPLKP